MQPPFEDVAKSTSYGRAKVEGEVKGFVGVEVEPEPGVSRSLMPICRACYSKRPSSFSWAMSHGVAIQCLLREFEMGAVLG